MYVDSVEMRGDDEGAAGCLSAMLRGRGQAAWRPHG